MIGDAKRPCSSSRALPIKPRPDSMSPSREVVTPDQSDRRRAMRQIKVLRRLGYVGRNLRPDAFAIPLDAARSQQQFATDVSRQRIKSNVVVSVTCDAHRVKNSIRSEKPNNEQE